MFTVFVYTCICNNIWWTIHCTSGYVLHVRTSVCVCVCVCVCVYTWSACSILLSNLTAEVVSPSWDGGVCEITEIWTCGSGHLSSDGATQWSSCTQELKASSIYPHTHTHTHTLYTCTVHAHQSPFLSSSSCQTVKTKEEKEVLEYFAGVVSLYYMGMYHTQHVHVHTLYPCLHVHTSTYIVQPAEELSTSESDCVRCHSCTEVVMLCVSWLLHWCLCCLSTILPLGVLWSLFLMCCIPAVF